MRFKVRFKIRFTIRKQKFKLTRNSSYTKNAYKKRPHMYMCGSTLVLYLKRLADWCRRPAALNHSAKQRIAET